MNDLVLSLFPGIGLLDQAFEEQGYCVVRGPDLLWGGDVRRFYPPPGKFAGVIGGPPCQVFSRMSKLGGTPAVDCIPEFIRCVESAAPEWFLMENVPEAPIPAVVGYAVNAVLFCDDWVGGETMRQRRFSFGTHDGRKLKVQQLALHNPEPARALLASTARRGVHRDPVKAAKYNDGGHNSRLPIAEYGRLQGASAVVDRLQAVGANKAFICHVLGNGVPLAMGRAVAAAVQAATRTT